jgi:ATP-dependent Lon protease
MPRDSSTKLSNKRDQTKRSKEASLKKKKNQSSDSDSNYGSDSENEEMNVHEFRKYVQKIFPSKHMENKIKAGEKLKKFVENTSSDEEEDNRKCKKHKVSEKSKNSKKSKKVVEESEEEELATSEDEKSRNKKSTKKNKKVAVSDDEEYSITIGSQDTEDDYEEDEEYEEEDEEYEEEDEEKVASKKQGKYNIIFTIGKADDEDVMDEEEDWEDECDSDYEDYEDPDDVTEDEDEEVSTDESSDEVAEPTKKPRTRQNAKQEVQNVKPVEQEDPKPSDVEKNEVLIQLKNLLAKNPKDRSIQKCISACEEELVKETKRKDKKNKKQKDKNMRIFRKIIRDKNTMNDFSFYEKLELEHQKRIIKELKEINKITRIEKPYRMTLLESTIPVQFKAAAIKKINSLKYMEPGSGEFYKIKNWVDTFMKIPFTNFKELPLNISDGVDKCHDFMENAQKTLDEAVYGLNDAKMQIMQMLGQLLTNPKAIGSAIAIHGPPGTGKTSLVKEGISKILNRPFAFIALGGATDSSFLEGHGYTYEGSTWGKIVQILIDSKCMNPVIYFDELDKISDTPRGEEIAGILTHLTDTSQNSQFHDKYFAEINFDLSKCLFIFSYNDESKVNPILKDRMYRIKTKGYSGKEKTVIANNYLLPKIHEQVRFNKDEIIIPDDIIGHIVENHCNKEDGVRNLKRCLEIIYTKLNLYRLMKPGSNLFEGEMSLKVEFPYKVTKDIVDKLIKKEQENVSALWSMYV